MSTSCFESSTQENVLIYRKTCNCLDAETEHSIYDNTWILSNTKNVYRWHVSLPNTSKFNIGILSNQSDAKKTYLFEYKNLSKDSMYFPFYKFDSISSQSSSENAVITLTLDLKRNAAALYCFQNGDTSSEQHINIPKGNNTKYKFLIQNINMLNQNDSIKVLKNVINHTCLFENYDLNSVSNIVSFARHTANCLVHGYISKNTTLAIPRVIKELCVYYFVGGKYFMEDVHQDSLSYLDTKSKRELFALILNIIFPGTQNVAVMLQQLIDFCHQFNAPYLSDFIHENNYFHQRKKSLFLSILISLTHVIEFYETLDEIESEINYNDVLFRIASMEDRLGIQLVYNLLKQNAKYYPLYKACVFPVSIAYSMRQYLFSICHKRSDILYLRQILLPFIYRGSDDNIDINSDASVMISFLLNKLAANRLFSAWLTHVWFEEIQWLWLNREVCVMASSESKYSDQYLMSIIFKVLSQIQSLDLISPEAPHAGVFSARGERHRCAQIAIELVHVISEMNDLNVEYEINNLDNLLEVVTIALRSNEIDIIGWKILNMEINKLHMDKNYKYFNDWIVYIESKCGLIKSNFINNINIIKNKCDGDKESAQKSLEIATKTCYNINKLQSFKLNKFVTLYAKITQTKLLKPILENL